MDAWRKRDEEAWEERNKRLAAETSAEALRGALGMDTPSPVHDLLDALADAADHLLRDHDCDRHGWEGIERRARAARERAAAIRAALAPSAGTGGGTEPEPCGYADEGWEAFPCTKPKGHDGDHACSMRMTLRPMRTDDFGRASQPEGGSKEE